MATQSARHFIIFVQILYFLIFAINYKYLIPLFPEPRKINGREFEYGQLQWAANFDSITGAKLYTANTVGSIQTSDKPASELNGLRNPIYNKTTIRNYNIFQII